MKPDRRKQGARSGVAVNSRLLTALAATLLAAVRVEAQHVAQLAISGGMGTDQRGARSNTISISPGLSIEGGGGSALAFNAIVTRYATASWSLGAGALFSGRETIGRLFALTLDVSANASQLRAAGNAAGTFASADALPALEVTAKRVTLFGGVRLATGSETQQVAQQPLPGFPASTTSERLTRTGVGPTFGLNIVVAATPFASLRVGAREDRLRVSGVPAADRSLSASLATADASLTGHVGRRRARDENVGFHAAALSLALRRDVALEVAGGRYAGNRIIGTPGGEFLSAGLSLRFGGAPAGRTPSTRVRGVPSVLAGYTRLSIDAPDAARVEVAGDFNQWTPVAATRARGGVWYADLRLAPGQYRYAFRVNGKEWRVPRGATAADDGFGGKSAWLTVEASRS